MTGSNQGEETGTAEEKPAETADGQFRTAGDEIIPAGNDGRDEIIPVKNDDRDEIIPAENDDRDNDGRDDDGSRQDVLSETYPAFLSESLSESGIDIEGLDLSGLIGNEPIEILVELSRAGRIDPWNIDIVEVTDSFLTRIEEMKMMDLRISGRTLLYACILLRMKSMEIDTEEEEEVPQDDDFGDDIPEDDDVDITMFPAPTLPIRRSPRRPVTLKELINALKKAEKSASKKRERSEEKELRHFVESALTTEDVIGIAHDEAILQRTGVLSAVLKQMFRGKERVSLEEVLSREGSDRIMDYVTLLFLTNLKEIDLWQEELFGPLYIYPKEIDPETDDSGTDDVVSVADPSSASVSSVADPSSASVSSVADVSSASVASVADVSSASVASVADPSSSSVASVADPSSSSVASVADVSSETTGQASAPERSGPEI